MANEKSYLGDTSKYDDIIKGLEKELEKTTGAKPKSEFTKAAAKMRELNKKQEPQYEANTEAIQAYLESKKEKKSTEPEYKINQEAMEKYAKEKDLKIVAKKVNEKLGVISYGITRNKKRIATIQREIDELEGKKSGSSASPEKKAFLSLTSSLSVIAASMKKINAALGGISKIRVAPEIAAPLMAPGLPMMGKKEGEPQKGFLELIKEFFTNPAVLAALAGIVYTVLPKELQEKIKGFLGGFASGLDSALGKDENSGMRGFIKAVKVAGIGIATYFGLKFIASVASAITTAINIAKLLGANVGKLGKIGKGGMKLSGKGKGIAAAVAVGGAAVTAGALMSGDDEEDNTTRKETAPSKPKPSATQSKQDLSVSSGTPSTSSTEAMTTPAGKPTPSTTYAGGAPTASENKMTTPGEGATGGDLEKYVNKQPGVDLSGIKPDVKKRLAGMAAEYQQTTGNKLQINSGYRSPEKQAALYAKIGSPGAAPPGHSYHEKGLAVDMNSSDASKAAQLGLFEKYGFKRPVAGEPWHIEAVETRSGTAYADNPVNPGAPVATVNASGKPVIPASGKSIPVSTAASSGTQINDASKDVKAASMPNGKTEVSSVNNTKQTGRNEKNKTPSHDIPSPIANRGSLEYYTKHSTFYV